MKRSPDETDTIKALSLLSAEERIVLARAMARYLFEQEQAREVATRRRRFDR